MSFIGNLSPIRIGPYCGKYEKWALSADQLPIDLFASKVFQFNKNLKPLVIIGGVHGDEPEGVELAIQSLNWFSHQEQQFPWIIIPCINPDGLSKNQRTNGHGVDLNRNFPAKSWTSECSAPRYYPGKTANSEPETRALSQLILSEKPHLVIHCHSWHPCVVYTGEPAKTYAQYLSESSGYPLKTEIGYPTPGSLSQFGWHDHQIPIICIEEQEHTDLKSVWPHFALGIEKIYGDFAKK